MMYSLGQNLAEIKYRLEEKHILLSDAIVLSLRLLRTVLPAKRLLWLNRELLGYLQDEKQDLKAELAGAKLTTVDSLYRQSAPFYRVLPGNWVPVARSSGGSSSDCEKEHSRSGSEFYMDGVVTLERIIAEDESENSTYVALEFDERAELMFLCETAEVKALYDFLCLRLSSFLNETIEFLESQKSVK